MLQYLAVYITLNRMNTESGRAPHPRAVILARVFLTFFGFACLFVAAGMRLGELPIPAWWAAYAAAAAGVAFLLSALFEPSRSVVGTFLIFFFPWH